jgi:hypothetical protein
MEGERYKKSPELLLQAVNHMPKMEAPCQFTTWKRWDKLEEYDAPEVVVFFAAPDILSGLFTFNMSFVTSQIWSNDSKLVQKSWHNLTPLMTCSLFHSRVNISSLIPAR